MTLRSSTSSLNSLGWFGSALLSSLEAKSMRPVGTQSRFTTPLTSLLNELFPPAKLAITVSGLGIAHSFSIREAKQPYLDWGVVTIKPSNDYPHHPYGGIQYVEHTVGDGSKMFKAVCKLGLEGIVSKKLMRPIARGRREPGSRSKIRKHRPQLALSTAPFDTLRGVRPLILVGLNLINVT